MRRQPLPASSRTASTTAYHSRSFGRGPWQAPRSLCLTCLYITPPLVHCVTRCRVCVIPCPECLCLRVCVCLCLYMFPLSACATVPVHLYLRILCPHLFNTPCVTLVSPCQIPFLLSPSQDLSAFSVRRLVTLINFTLSKVTMSQS